MGERAHLAALLDPAAIDLDLHRQDVTQLLEYEDLSDVVLVGHAYAGMVITAVAESCPGRLRHLVYVNAVIPGDGEAMADQVGAVRGPEFAAWVRSCLESEEGVLPPPASADEVGRRWGITDTADQAWMSTRVTAQPAASFAQPVRLGRPEAKALPRSFVSSSEAGFEVVAERARALGWDMHHIDSGHDSMVTHPEELADILLEIAGGG
jgi:pimeloyl-ACP methyl ester carboxylesterase